MLFFFFCVCLYVSRAAFINLSSCSCLILPWHCPSLSLNILCFHSHSTMKHLITRGSQLIKSFMHHHIFLCKTFTLTEMSTVVCLRIFFQPHSREVIHLLASDCSSVRLDLWGLHCDLPYYTSVCLSVIRRCLQLASRSSRSHLIQTPFIGALLELGSQSQNKRHLSVLFCLIFSNI